MNGYEITPEYKSTAEKVLVALALIFAAGSFGVSRVSGVPQPEGQGRGKSIITRSKSSARRSAP